MTKQSFTFHFFALAALGDGLSGGDRIFIEFARRWAKAGHQLHIYLWQEGYQITQAQHLNHPNITFHIVNLGIWPKFGFLVNYFIRIIAGIRLGLTLSPGAHDYLYSASDFWMDVFPAQILKLRFPLLCWFAGWYQTAPNPIKGYTQGQRQQTYRLLALLYWLSQLIVKPLITRHANYILVNNPLEKTTFPSVSDKKLVVVLGAVDTEAIHDFMISHPKVKKTYAAVFQGRFHPQKGVLELVEIWSLVTKKIPSAKLLMVGDGELMPAVKNKIASLNLTSRIDLPGYVFDGQRKNLLFSSSRIVVHPSFFDSGGMASAEAMAFGLPCVGFNLPAYASYYPKGMVKVPIGDLNRFASSVTALLSDLKLYTSLAKQAKSLIDQQFSWNERASNVLNQVTS